jgi:hypothetical protein
MMSQTGVSRLAASGKEGSGGVFGRPASGAFVAGKPGRMAPGGRAGSAVIPPSPLPAFRATGIGGFGAPGAEAGPPERGTAAAGF